MRQRGNLPKSTKVVVLVDLVQSLEREELAERIVDRSGKGETNYSPRQFVAPSRSRQSGEKRRTREAEVVYPL